MAWMELEIRPGGAGVLVLVRMPGSPAEAPSPDLSPMILGVRPEPPGPPPARRRWARSLALWGGAGGGGFCLGVLAILLLAGAQSLRPDVLAAQHQEAELSGSPSRSRLLGPGAPLLNQSPAERWDPPAGQPISPEQYFGQ